MLETELRGLLEGAEMRRAEAFRLDAQRLPNIAIALDDVVAHRFERQLVVEELAGVTAARLVEISVVVIAVIDEFAAGVCDTSINVRALAQQGARHGVDRRHAEAFQAVVHLARPPRHLHGCRSRTTEPERARENPPLREIAGSGVKAARSTRARAE